MMHQILQGLKENDFEVIYSGNSQDGWLHSGIALLSDNRLVFEAPGGNGIILLDPQTLNQKKIPVDIAVAHGITTTFEDEHDFIWICDPGEKNPGKVIKIDLDGNIIRTITPPGSSPLSEKNWRPTSIAIANNGDIWVADGYGLNLVHVYRVNGTTETFDGSASGINFNCPHGVAVDERNSPPTIAIADRRNRRIVFMAEDGSYIRSVTAEIMIGPSSIAVGRDALFVTDLFGAVISVSQEDEVSALIQTTNSQSRPGWPNAFGDVAEKLVAPTIPQGAVNSPHGIALSPDGILYFTEWFLGGRVVRLPIFAKMTRQIGRSGV
jgi:DNA-binding beta-propeller fold protein YncE